MFKLSCANTIIILIAIACLHLPAKANPIIYMAPSDTQNASFNGELPIKQIGPLLLPKAVVQFKGTEVNILAVPEWLFDRSLVLSGAVVKAEINIQGKANSLSGLVYFSNGLWLSNLGSSRAIDIIDTISGDQLRGKIRARLDNAFAFKPENGPVRKLSFSEIKNIKSPYAYVFSINTDPEKTVTSANSLQFESSNISFTPASGHGSTAKAKTPRSTLAGTEPGISNTAIGTMIGINVLTDLAPAIAIPLSLNSGTVSQAQREINFYTTTQQRANGIAVPIKY